MISQLKEKERIFPIQQTPLEGTAKQPLVQAQIISQPWCDTLAADSVVTPADKHTHCKHLRDEGLVRICIEPIFSSAADITAVLLKADCQEHCRPLAILLSLCLATPLAGHDKLTCSLNLMPISFLWVYGLDHDCLREDIIFIWT